MSPETGARIEVRSELDREKQMNKGEFLFEDGSVLHDKKSGLAPKSARKTAQNIFTLAVGLICCGHLDYAQEHPSGMKTEKLALYRQANAPIEKRIDDLLRRMTLEEKVRQLDMYAGAKDIVDRHTDDTHAAADSVFVPEKAQREWGNLGVGSIHDLNPTPEQ